MAQEGIDCIFAASVFEQSLSVLFMDEGVWQLHNHQQNRGMQRADVPALAERKNISAQIESFSLYDIENVYADKKSVRLFSLSKKDLVIKPAMLGDKEIRNLTAQHEVVLTY